jgi:hypothetical protein
MTRIAFFKKYFLKFSAGLVLVGLIVYTIYHVRGASASGLMTTPTKLITDMKLVSGEGYVFRDESVLTVDGFGVINDLVESGSKVSKNAEISQVWNGYGQTELDLAQAELEQLNRLIAVMEKSLVTPGTTIAQAEQYRHEAGSLYLALQQKIEAGEWSSLYATSDEMLALLNRYGYLIGAEDSAEGALARLKDEKAKLLQGDCLTVQNLQASGVFYDRACVDGYESIYTVDLLDSLSIETLDTLKETDAITPHNQTVVGKMVYGYTWYLAVEIAGDISLFEPGASYEISFPACEGSSLSMTCQKLIGSNDGRFAAIFSTEDSPAWFSYRRVQSVEITVGSSTGYYVPDSALVQSNGVDGVYIFRDSTVYFRRIEILYRGEGYCIVAEQGERGDDYLSLYDILITSGKNLYDGKVY